MIFKATLFITLSLSTITAFAAKKNTAKTDAIVKAKDFAEAKKLARKPSSETVYESAGQKFRVETLATVEDSVWGFDFLPDDRIVFTGKSEGTVNVLDLKTHQITSISGRPTSYQRSQGGMLDVRVGPSSTKTNAQIYLTYTTEKGLEFGRGDFADNKITGYRRFFASLPESSGGNQFGSRIEFDGKGHVFITSGDHGDRTRVQDLSTHYGKVLRFNEDGTVPDDNPFVKTANAQKEIWALGLRSPEGLTIRPGTDEIWEAEMGPLGGDEVNLIKRGGNYGWPVISWGREYSGEPVGLGEHEKEGMEQPIVYWQNKPEKYHITPCGITFYNGDVFPKWKGNAFIGTLATAHLHRLVLDGHKVTQQEELLTDLHQRIRNVRPGKDGYLYFSTDSGLIARLVPAK